MDTLRLPEDQLAALTRGLLDGLAERFEARLAAIEQAVATGGELPPGLVSAREIAGKLGVSVDVVYDSADDLGVVRVGKPGSKRPRLLFDPAVALKGRPQPAAPAPARRRKQPAAPSPSVPLLPIKGKISQ